MTDAQLGADVPGVLPRIKPLPVTACGAVLGGSGTYRTCVAQPRKLHDIYFKMAKEEGYVARSAYKLLEINPRKRIIRRGDRVLDLGCSPGSWLQVVEKIIGRDGVAVGIDLQPVTIPEAENVYTLIGDIFKTDAAVLRGKSGLFFDVVLSDMAPNTTGHGDDHLSARLCERVMDLLPEVLRKGGNMCMKILEGEPTPDVIARAKTLFAEAGTTKPKASRDVSREIFIWGVGYGLPPRQRVRAEAEESPRRLDRPRRER